MSDFTIEKSDVVKCKIRAYNTIILTGTEAEIDAYVTKQVNDGNSAKLICELIDAIKATQYVG